MKKLIALSLCMLLLACKSAEPIKHDYTAFKQADPKSILILTPLNSSPDPQAIDSILANATRPLAESGYYVIPVTLMSNLFKANGIVSGHDAQNISLEKLRQYFGADAALYLDISKYGSSYQVFDSVTEVAVNARLVDLKTNQVLWSNSLSLRNSSNDGNQGLLVAIISAAVSQIINSSKDNAYNLSDTLLTGLLSASTQENGLILHGPYSPDYWKTRAPQ